MIKKTETLIKLMKHRKFWDALLQSGSVSIPFDGKFIEIELKKRKKGEEIPITLTAALKKTERKFKQEI